LEVAVLAHSLAVQSYIQTKNIHTYMHEHTHKYLQTHVLNCFMYAHSQFIEDCFHTQVLTWNCMWLHSCHGGRISSRQKSHGNNMYESHPNLEGKSPNRIPWLHFSMPLASCFSPSLTSS
jgi:hypothetical protein